MSTNITYDRIYKGLKLVLGKNTVIMNEVDSKASEYVRLSVETSPELLENTGPTFAMRYFINIDIVMNRAKRAKYVTQAVSNVLHKLNSNPAYTANGVYYWHDMAILTSEAGEELDEDGKALYAWRILWTATHTECK